MTGHDWRQHHADEAEKAVRHDLVASAIDELLDNLGRTTDGLARYGLMKVAHYAAQVARAHALGFDPDLCRLTATEANASLIERAALAAMEGVPVWVIAEGDTAEAGQ